MWTSMSLSAGETEAVGGLDLLNINREREASQTYIYT